MAERSRTTNPVAIRVPAWRTRLDDPAEPLFTMAIVCELLATDAQTVRRLEHGVVDTNRTDGNHRRYSRDDVVRLGDALELLRAGVPRAAIARVLTLQARVDVLEAVAPVIGR